MSAIFKPQELNFRPVSETDLDRILEIENQAYEFPWTKNIFRDCLRVGYNCWLLEEADDIVSYGIMSVAAGECHILNLCVAPKWQDQQFGQSMLHFLLDTAIRFNADTAFLEVRPSNKKAHHVYLKSGFAEVGSRKSYYPSHKDREDAIILAKPLINEMV